MSLPLSRVSISASRSASAAIRSASLRRSAPRAVALILAHDGARNAFHAASTEIGIFSLECLARPGVHPFAADQHLIALHKPISAPDLLRQALFSTSAKASRAIRNESPPAGMRAQIA